MEIHQPLFSEDALFPEYPVEWVMAMRIQRRILAIISMLFSKNVWGCNENIRLLFATVSCYRRE